MERSRPEGVGGRAPGDPPEPGEPLGARLPLESGGSIHSSQASVEEPLGALESPEPSKPEKRKYGSKWAKKTVLTPARTPNDRVGWLHGPDCRCSMLACRAERRNPPSG